MQSHAMMRSGVEWFEVEVVSQSSSAAVMVEDIGAWLLFVEWGLLIDLLLVRFCFGRTVGRFSMMFWRRSLRT